MARPQEGRAGQRSLGSVVNEISPLLDIVVLEIQRLWSQRGWNDV